MIKKLIKHGNSQMIYLPKNFLQIMNLEIGQNVKVDFDGEKIIITKEK